MKLFPHGFILFGRLYGVESVEETEVQKAAPVKAEGQKASPINAEIQKTISPKVNPAKSNGPKAEIKLPEKEIECSGVG